MTDPSPASAASASGGATGGVLPAVAPERERSSPPGAHPLREAVRERARDGGDVPRVAWRAALPACLALAALSLLGPAQPTYDPWAWIIWGREITQGDLVTTYGPSWKPLPVLFTAPFALIGDDAAPLLWLLIARTGGLMAIWAAWALAARLAGRVAGTVAAAGLLLSDDFVRHFARGNSEGMLVAFCLLAVLAHLHGRRGAAFALGFLAGLLRPEVWPFLALYGLWLAWKSPSARKWVFAAGLVTVVLWFVPEQIGSGDWLRAAERAMQTTPDSAAQAAVPFLEVFLRAAGLLSVPVYAGALVCVVLALRAPRGDEQAKLLLALAAGSAALMLGVALMTQLGFAGNLRYVSLPASLVCVLAGVGWVRGVAAARRYLGPGRGRAAAVAAGLVVLALLIPPALSFAESMGRVHDEAEVTSDLETAIQATGGRDAVCGSVVTGRYEVQMLAWALGVHGAEVGLDGPPPRTVFTLRRYQRPPDPAETLAARTEHWEVTRACGR